MLAKHLSGRILGGFKFSGNLPGLPPAHRCLITASACQTNPALAQSQFVRADAQPELPRPGASEREMGKGVNYTNYNDPPMRALTS